MIFAQPLILWGLLAVLIPVAVHLFNFRRYRKVYFSNVDRLRELQTESRRSSELRRWLVLLARVLAVALLVLAFAQPSLPSGEGNQRSGATVVSVYIDNSFSMENSSSDGSQLEAAKRKAREITAAYRPSDRYQLLSNRLDGEEMRWLSRDEFLDAVSALDINPASRRLSDVASRQADFMRQSGAPNRHAYLISDFQTSIADLGNLPTLPSPPSPDFTLVPVEGVAADNLYIDTLRLDAPAYFTGGSVTVEATVRNSGSHDIEKLPVRLFVNGRERALATLDIPSGTAAKALLRFTIDSAGWHDGRVEITDYPVTFDDSYFFSLLAGERIAMLELDGTHPNENLQRLFSADSAVDYHALPCNGSAVATDRDFILLNEVDNLSSGQAQALASWVAEGGTLTVVPPANAKVETLNGLLALLGAPRLEGWSTHAVKAQSIDYHSSLYRDVFSGTSDEMELPSVQGHYRLAAGTVSQPVITLADGSPLLTTTPHGTGRLYLFATPLSAEWTDLVSQALFVPTLYNMALYSRPLPPPAYTLGTTAPIFLQGLYDPAATPPSLSAISTLRSPLSILPDLRRVGNRSALFLHGELAEAGIYRLADEHLAFNYDRMESQLDYLTHSDLGELLDGREGYSLVRNAAKPLDEEIRSREGGTPLWRWCILAALLALAAETLLLKQKRCSSKSTT